VEKYSRAERQRKPAQLAGTTAAQIVCTNIDWREGFIITDFFINSYVQCGSGATE
jgi:hypothetical protein